MKHQGNYGYSLYEFIIVLAIIGTMLKMALPVISHQVMNNNNTTTYIQLQAVIKYAQEEAIRQSNNTILICPANFSVNGALSGDFCNGASSDWSKGILAFRNLNGRDSYSGNTLGRLEAVRFDHHITVTLQVDGTNTVVNKLRVSSNGQLSDNYGSTAWQLRLTQTVFGYTSCKVGSFNQYGVFALLSGC